ncbi:hypothetical protein EUGRSUZ_E02272 [Eucalyptus grandis]|uniref:TIR domain-containing protein n=2 Tax=Eucalyptus grandis TaxID=71139 RepID=A0A059C652_EUCGR|nr:hypothetical protein EUGRSUZ_E02272 [Eucalyptus grandis]
MASSSDTEKAYHVFLSFRGADLRKSFVSHLYQALKQKGIHTFRDNEELEKGDEISPVLMKAIEESCIAIIVFSDDYASSRWCLEELAKIMECREPKNLTVLPVFYKVDPREVREGRNSYQRALNKHESKLGKNSEKVLRWKKALFAAGNLSGWHLNDGDESKLVQRIVIFISTQLRRTPLHVADYPVGIDSQVVKLRGMLNLESTDDVLIMGLWGPGGIGKTTLAKAIYNDVFRLFEGSSFLAHVRENSKNYKDLVALQEKLLNDVLLPEKHLGVFNVDDDLIRQRLGRKKVLIILDDVDSLHQLRALAGKDKWFGNGSRIIITTRDSHLLTSRDIDQDHVYEVTVLNDDKARELLGKYAFPTHQKLKIRTEIVNGVLDHAKGLPLALEVLGSFLRNRGEAEWVSTLRRLSRFPNKTINDVLKISYMGLEEDHKEIFLHIACFFKGWTTNYIDEILYSCDFEPTIGLKVLSERSLIKINYGTLEMHDLIQSMGMHIVKQECDDPRRRSRLWLYEDVVDVLSRDTGDCDVKAIVLNPPVPIEISVSGDAFIKMRRLMLLILRNVSFQAPICLPNEVRWFEWPGAPRFPEFASGPKKLVRLDLSKGMMTIVPKPLEVSIYVHRPFYYPLHLHDRQLKDINFSSCNLLVHTPDISCAPNLEKLKLHGCRNLVGVHESIANHDNLQWVNLAFCSKLRNLPKELKSKNLHALNLHGCKKIERFPDIPHKLENLKGVTLCGTAIKELPESIGNLVSLESMDLKECSNLVALPSNIYKLQNLTVLRLTGCENLVGFPKLENSADPCIEPKLSKLQYTYLRGSMQIKIVWTSNSIGKDEYGSVGRCFVVSMGKKLAKEAIRREVNSADLHDNAFSLLVSSRFPFSKNKLTTRS